jgi:drug/metabolite transporter (DMT)-like permease
MQAITQRKIEFPGPAAVFLCAVLWSTSGLFIKLIDANPFVIAGTRSFIGGLTMIALRLLFMREPFALLGRTLKMPAFWLSGIVYAVTLITFTVANKLTTSANAILIQYSAPAWAAIFGLLLIREKPRTENWIALAIVAAGLMLFFKGALESASMLGDMIALFSGICFGLQSVLLRMQKESDPAYGLILAHIITALVAIPFYFLYPPPLVISSLGAILFLGIFQIGLASILFAYGMKRVNAFAALIIACIEPVINPVWVLLVTGEKPSATAIAGGAVILFAVLFSNIATALGRPGRLLPSPLRR